MRLTLATFFLFLNVFLNGQYTVSGTIMNKKLPLTGVSVVVLNSSDSTLVSFGITDLKGRFEIYDVPSGGFVLQTSYIGFETMFTNISVSKNVDIPDIQLKESDKILKEVQISAERIPMGIIGDTINYNAAAFQTKEGATVEDLLKKMPGIDVARDGTIKAFGEDVENILVDGKEFFNGDPTMATKNLEAEAIEKVQVFDKTSEDADFTGIDDGIEEKTINLSLKEDYKNGGFGRISAEAGSQRRHKLKGNYNRFSPSFQASAIGNSNNINENAFSFNDYISFMGGLSNLLSDGNIETNGYLNDSPQEGINNQQALGLNFNYFKNKNWNLSSNYMFVKNTNRLIGNTYTKQSNDEFIFETIDSINTIDDLQNHKIRIKSEHFINTLNKINLKINSGFRFNENQTNNKYDYYNNDNLIQRIDNNEDQFGHLFTLNSSLKYLKKYKTEGKLTSLKYSFNIDLLSDNTTLQNQINTSSQDIQFINQNQQFFNTEKTINLSLDHTEAISKKMYATVGVNFFNNRQTPYREHFDLNDGQMTKNENLSSSFYRQWSKYNLYLKWRKNGTKWKINASLLGALTNLNANENSPESIVEIRKPYVLANGDISYKVSSISKLSFQYFGELEAPKLNQLISIPNNFDPNNTIIGNKYLTNEYIHNISLDYNFFEQFSFMSVFANARYKYSQNKIVFERNVSSDLTSISQAYQSPNYHDLNLYFTHSKPIRPLKIKYSITSIVNYQLYDTKLNDLPNTVGSTYISNNLKIENRNKKKLDLAIGIQASLSNYTNSISSELIENFIEYKFYADGLYHLSESFNFTFQYDYKKILGQSSIAESNTLNLHLVNLELNKTFKNNKWTSSLKIHDLLNQNQGISRYGSLNTLYVNQYNTLNQYFTLGLKYKIGNSMLNQNEIKM